MTAPGWITNDPDAAKALRAADRRYELARAQAQDLPLAAKLAAYRDAKGERLAAYDSILEQHDARS